MPTGCDLRWDRTSGSCKAGFSLRIPTVGSACGSPAGLAWGRGLPPSRPLCDDREPPVSVSVMNSVLILRSQDDVRPAHYNSAVRTGPGFDVFEKRRVEDGEDGLKDADLQPGLYVGLSHGL